jgi:C4-dicarboxylate-specific signal transduction histidine kinase
VNQVLNAKVQKRTMKLAQVNHALQAEIRVRQRSKAARVAIEEAPLLPVG